MLSTTRRVGGRAICANMGLTQATRRRVGSEAEYTRPLPSSWKKEWAGPRRSSQGISERKRRWGKLGEDLVRAFEARRLTTMGTWIEACCVRRISNVRSMGL